MGARFFQAHFLFIKRLSYAQCVIHMCACKQESKALFDAIDNGSLSLTKIALDFGGDIEYVMNGKTPFQMIFCRLCRIEANIESDPLLYLQWNDNEDTNTIEEKYKKKYNKIKNFVQNNAFHNNNSIKNNKDDN